MATNARHILFVDDNLLLLRSLELAIAQEGYRIGTAKNGLEALAYIRLHGPDIVVLDIFMPDMDGFETLQAIRQEFPNLRTIVVSGGGASEDFRYLDMTTKLGADAVLQKPFTAQQLLSVALA